MSDFTYQKNETAIPRETYEWDRTWIEHTEITDAKVFPVSWDTAFTTMPQRQTNG